MSVVTILTPEFDVWESYTLSIRVTRLDWCDCIVDLGGGTSGSASFSKIVEIATVLKAAAQVGA